LDPNSAENSRAEPPPAVNRGETIEYQLLVSNFTEQDPSSNTSAQNNAQGLTIRVPPKYLYSVCLQTESTRWSPVVGSAHREETKHWCRIWA
jgi:hypothetical protein